VEYPRLVPGVMLALLSDKMANQFDIVHQLLRVVTIHNGKESGSKFSIEMPGAASIATNNSLALMQLLIM
jgi:hypothetical protein